MLRFQTTIGTCAVQWDGAGITRVHLPRARELTSPSAPGCADVPASVRDAVTAITRLLEGEPQDLTEVVLSDRPLARSGRGVEPFARRVYAATRAVGPGQTTTYGAVAAAVGDPGAARAVGAALGANPWPIVVPCHRVLATDGSLHGFSAPGGITTKRRMLEIERAPGFTQQPLFA